MECSTEGASIRYTLDGSALEIDSPEYGGPFEVTETTTLKAVAFLDGWDDSGVAEADYVITGKVAAPWITPEAGIYTEAQTISMECSTEGASIRYTLDGSAPEIDSPEYGGPFEVTETTTLKAVAFLDGWDDSGVAEADYVITGKVAAPVISPEAGVFTEAQTVSIICSTDGAAIRYTLDGSEPAADSSEYTGPFEVSETAIIKAAAFLEDWENSGIVEAEFVITGKVASPVISPEAGVYTEGQNVSIECSTEGVTIRYTMDGSEPSADSLEYTGPFEVSETATVKAAAFLDGWDDSGVAEADFIITGKVAAPVISLEAGTYTQAQTISMECSTDGATIRHTLDGSDPAADSSEYTGPFEVSETATVKAAAFLEGWEESRIAEAEFVITGKVAAPVISPEAGVYTQAHTISIECSTDGASIRYTLDGSDPTVGSPEYTGPFEVSETAIIKAAAFLEDWENSGIVEAEFVITGKVAAPTISPEAGIYTQAQIVALECSTEGATIRYTWTAAIPRKNHRNTPGRSRSARPLQSRPPPSWTAGTTVVLPKLILLLRGKWPSRSYPLRLASIPKARTFPLNVPPTERRYATPWTAATRQKAHQSIVGRSKLPKLPRSKPPPSWAIGKIARSRKPII